MGKELLVILVGQHTQTNSNGIYTNLASSNDLRHTYHNLAYYTVMIACELYKTTVHAHMTATSRPQATF